MGGRFNMTSYYTSGLVVQRERRRLPYRRATGLIGHIAYRNESDITCGILLAEPDAAVALGYCRVACLQGVSVEKNPRTLHEDAIWQHRFIRVVLVQGSMLFFYLFGRQLSAITFDR
jgi:hypothetical protein